MSKFFVVGWRQVAACFLLLSATGMIAATYSIIAVPLAQEFQPSRMVLMLAMTVWAGSSAIMYPMAGGLMDRVSVRKLMLLGGLCLGAGYAALSLATSFVHVLIIFAVLLAPANVLIGPLAMTVLLSRWFVTKRGRAIGFAVAGISAGGFLFPMIIQGLLDANQWREALQILAVLLLVWTIPAALLVVDRPADRSLNPDGANDEVEAARQESDAPGISARRILTDPSFWLIAGTVGVVTAGMKGMITNLAPMAIDNGIDATDAAFLVSIYAGCSFLTKLNFAALADRIGPRIMMGGSLAGYSLGMACLTQAHMGYWAIALGVAMTGLFGGVMIPMESYLAPRVFGQRAVGRAMGLMSGLILVGLLATPPLFGLIFDLWGSYTGIFWTFCGLALIALIGMPRLRLHPRELEMPANGEESEETAKRQVALGSPP